MTWLIFESSSGIWPKLEATPIRMNACSLNPLHTGFSHVLIMHVLALHTKLTTWKYLLLNVTSSLLIFLCMGGNTLDNLRHFCLCIENTVRVDTVHVLLVVMIVYWLDPCTVLSASSLLPLLPVAVLTYKTLQAGVCLFHCFFGKISWFGHTSPIYSSLEIPTFMLIIPITCLHIKTLSWGAVTVNRFHDDLWSSENNLDGLLFFSMWSYFFSAHEHVMLVFQVALGVAVLCGSF